MVPECQLHRPFLWQFVWRGDLARHAASAWGRGVGPAPIYSPNIGRTKDGVCVTSWVPVRRSGQVGARARGPVLVFPAHAAVSVLQRPDLYHCPALASLVDQSPANSS